MKRIALIGTVGIPARYGGFETLAQQLVEKNEGGEFGFLVYCSAKHYTDRPDTLHSAKLKYWSLKANGIQSIFYDIVSIIHAVRHCDTLLILGVSGAVVIPVVKLFTKKTIITHIDGLEWKREKWNRFAKRFLKFSEKVAVKYSGTVISDNEAIKDYVENEYNCTSDLIEYGGDHILPVVGERTGDYAFSVCRIEPENNIHLILEAFSRCPEKEIRFVGNWEGNPYARQLFERYKHFENIRLIMPIYDQQKLDEIRGNCAYYIHGHSAGGTNPSLVEAMYLGLPIVAYDVPYNRNTTEQKSLYFQNEEALIEVLRNTAKGHWSEMGKVMHEIARKRYTWDIIVRKYNKLFDKK